MQQMSCLIYFCCRRFENLEKSIFSKPRREIVNENARICEESKKKNPTPMPVLSSKTKMAVWFAKDCTFTKGARVRLKILKALKTKGLEIGGDPLCYNESTQYRYLTMNDMLNEISKYKFYLAFENAYYCNDYITEKLWVNSYYVGVVPVVWGASKENYIRVAPENSFIFYEDFKTSQELVDYLKYLDKNDTAYMEYFEWRKSYPCDYPLYETKDEEYPYTTKSSSSLFFNTYCNLCRMVRNSNIKMQSISSLKNYWFEGLEEKCLNS